ncbi:hypothetical protein C8J57DRAFT_1471678 [Mycena rebaudengoi]|nr:hypothetical protein C8J57DRAFT_1471678 [Mycena rebaudengoi]
MSSTRLPYIQHHGLGRHPGSVLTLAATEDGAILASSGSQGTRLWDVTDMLMIERPSATGHHGATLVMIWVRQADESHNVLYAGTQNGYFYCWRKEDGVFEETFVVQMHDPGEITAMVFDSTNNRLCLCSCNDIVQSWAISKDPLTGKWTPISIFSRRFPMLVPQAIMFAVFDNSPDRDIIVLGLHNSGPIYTICGKTGETASNWSVGGKIGDAVFNWKDGVFCLDNPASGIALFRISDQIKAKSYEIDRKRKNARTRKVCFGSMGQLSSAAVTTGERLEILSVGSSEWVQVIATTEIGGVSVIFAAQMRALDCSEEIFIWKRARDTSIGWEPVVVVLKAMVVLGFLAFLYQNLS